jgi:hypothetical protein
VVDAIGVGVGCGSGVWADATEVDATGGAVSFGVGGAEHAATAMTAAIRMLAATSSTVVVVVRRDTGAPWHGGTRPG